MNVLVATDLSEASLAAVDSVCACQSGVFDKATLLRVVDLDLCPAGGSIPQIMEYATSVLPAWADRLTNCGIEAQTRVAQGPAAETIEEAAAETGADLVVMKASGIALSPAASSAARSRRWLPAGACRFSSSGCTNTRERGAASARAARSLAYSLRRTPTTR